jgi:hypothetical protein
MSRPLFRYWVATSLSSYPLIISLRYYCGHPLDENPAYGILAACIWPFSLPKHMLTAHYAYKQYNKLDLNTKNSN